ncbi:MAG: site-specific DNA-methyltransferase [Cocleimonas sp.]|nr:site-specific DNA-methyltransferase [Cocleimonas sp.]
MTQSSEKSNKDKEVKHQLITKLKEMFQLDQPELDFGLYKIMHAKADQISQFIETDLTEHIDKVFGEASTQDSHAQLQKAKEDVIATLGEAAFDSEGNLNEQFKQIPAAKPYIDALQASKNNGGTLSNSASIYDHLYRFFSRYYDSGDFLSRRYHVAENAKRAAPYAVPYDGREVYLHWANKDQYYIKTSESFNSYTFNLTEAVAKQQGDGELSFGSTDESRKIHFQLLDADEGEHNNVKENQARFFIIHADEPVKFNEQNELVLQFEYRADPNKKGQNNTWQDNKLKEAESLIFETLDSQSDYKSWSADLKTPAPTEKNKSRTLLAKYLKQYTARNTMDYFIHKDLGGFLSRELDFYIKNEIMHLDDIEQSDAVTVESWLLKVRVLRLVAKKVISFLAQLEEFQKKLWLKKKFVTETNYCMTLDRVPEVFYEEIVGNQKQLDEWVDLGFTTKDTKYTKEKLKENPFLVIDTGLFDASFNERLLAEIEDLDETTDGVLIHSENFQALNLMQERYREQVKCVYIDPPYNTGGDGFIYRDSYQHSSWISLLIDRLVLSKSLMNNDAAFFSSIDDAEVANLRKIGDSVFSENCFIADAIWRSKDNSNNDTKRFSYDFNHTLVFSKKDSWQPAKLQDKSKRSHFNNPDNDPRGAYFDGNPLNSPNYRENLIYDLKSPQGNRIKPPKNGWRWSQEAMQQKISTGEIKFTLDGKSIRRRTYLKDMDGLPPSSLWVDLDKTGHNRQAKYELLKIIPEDIFETPKPIKLLSYIMNLAKMHLNDCILDFFSGSGTTAHATINLNREDDGNRKYILVEMGEYFDTVLKPRIKKVVYSENWKKGKPVTLEVSITQLKKEITKAKKAIKELQGYDDPDEYHFEKQKLQGVISKSESEIERIQVVINSGINGFGGISHCFKYNRLESYEDTINNLITTNQVDPKNLPDEYILNYLLETETAESPSLINIEQFKDPTNYRLTVKKPGSDEQAEQAIDLIETFNWLIGLRVEELDKWRSYNAEFSREKDPELPDDQHTRLFANKLKECDAYSAKAGEYHLRLIEGWCCRTAGDTSNTDKVLVVWRKLTDDLEKDAAMLEAVLNKKGVNQADSEYDLIYINGSHGLQLSGQSKSRLISLEETFMAKMWEDAV